MFTIWSNGHRAVATFAPSKYWAFRMNLVSSNFMFIDECYDHHEGV